MIKRQNLTSAFAILQRMGQSLMVPVSVLPAAGLLIALGRVFPEGHLMHEILVQGGLSVFKQLPLLFAIGVAIGLSGGAGVAGLAAAVGYFLLAALLDVASQALTPAGQEVMKIDTGVFGGIVIGFVAASAYKRFHQVQLPEVFGFFSGKRLVPIMTAVFSVLVVGALILIWPPIQNGIRSFGHWVTESSLGPAFYAAGKRLLIPVGLHHVYYPSFLYEFGEFIKASGEVIRGDSARYFAGDPTAGRFMAAEFPIMLFGLPAAALAIVLRAEASKRKLVAGVMLSAALTSILTGITEPIEFSFIFVAPILYLVHVGFAFVSGLMTNAFEIQLGYTFSASLIDFVVGYFNQKNSMYLWLVVGPCLSLMYFSGFYFLIGQLNLATPGREVNIDANISETSGVIDPSAEEGRIVEALGGLKNIRQIDACITRLRLQLHNPTLVNEAKLKTLGAAGVMKAGESVQVVFGTKSDQIKERILQLIEKAEIFNFVSPLEGEIVDLKEVPDKTFSEKILGDGFAIRPTGSKVVSPVDGTVVSLIGSNHAIGLVTEDQFEVLIHVGIDTVQLQGEGFKALVKEGDRVHRGQPLIEFDLEFIGSKCPSTLTPVIFTSTERWHWAMTQSENKDKVSAGAPILKFERLSEGQA